MRCAKVQGLVQYRCSSANFAPARSSFQLDKRCEPLEDVFQHIPARVRHAEIAPRMLEIDPNAGRFEHKCAFDKVLVL